MRKRLTNIFLIMILTAMAGLVPVTSYAGDPEVSEILAGAAEQLEDTESMAFTMEIEGTTYVDGAESIRLEGAEGVMQRPDRVDVTFTAEVLGMQQISIRMITIGEEAWITDIVTGKWVTSPPEFGYNPAVLYDPDDGLAPLMEQMTEKNLEGSEKIDGRDAWHVSAEVDGDVISKMTSGTMSGSSQSVELWIDKETSDILRIKIAEPTDEDIEDPATWILTLSKHNEDVTIENPTD